MARLFALLGMALSDTVAPTVMTKYVYHSWRPATAILEAHTDGNAHTESDPAWSPRAGGIGTSPEYWSGHSTFSAAGAATLAAFYCADDIPFELTTDSRLPARSAATRAFPRRRRKPANRASTAGSISGSATGTRRRRGRRSPRRSSPPRCCAGAARRISDGARSERAGAVESRSNHPGCGEEFVMSLKLGDLAPTFTAETTHGTIDFHQWLGDRWGVYSRIPGTSPRCVRPSSACWPRSPLSSSAAACA